MLCPLLHYTSCSPSSIEDSLDLAKKAPHEGTPSERYVCFLEQRSSSYVGERVLRQTSTWVFLCCFEAFDLFAILSYSGTLHKVLLPQSGCHIYGN